MGGGWEHAFYLSSFLQKPLLCLAQKHWDTNQNSCGDRRQTQTLLDLSSPTEVPLILHSLCNGLVSTQ